MPSGLWQNAIPLPSRNTMISSVSNLFGKRISNCFSSPLEQEYDAQADVDKDKDGSVNNYNVPRFTPQSVALGSHDLSGSNHPRGVDGVPRDPEWANQLLGQYELILDADPFGVSASMHFPTPLNYGQNNFVT